MRPYSCRIPSGMANWDGHSLLFSATLYLRNHLFTIVYKNDYNSLRMREREGGTENGKLKFFCEHFPIDVGYGFQDKCLWVILCYCLSGLIFLFIQLCCCYCFYCRLLFFCCGVSPSLGFYHSNDNYNNDNDSDNVDRNDNGIQRMRTMMMMMMTFVILCL